MSSTFKNTEEENLPLVQLQNFINRNEIPLVKDKPKTFLSIAKQPHYENVISNIYAFFFRIHEAHKLNDLFINSLIELIDTKLREKGVDPLVSFKDFEVETEYGVMDQKRIDILLRNEKQVIIIENKVNHILNNDLALYYNSIKAQQKVGIVLSLQNISNINHPNFINITHLELINRITQNLGNYLLLASDKYLVFLKDFIQNIINLSLPYMEEKNIDFYYKNQKEINQLYKFKNQLLKHIISETKKAGQILEGVNVLEPRIHSYHDKRLMYYISKNFPNLMYTIVFEDLLKMEKSMYIVVEMKGHLLKDRNQYSKIDFTDAEKSVFAEHFLTTNFDWSHFAIKHCTPNEKEIAKLSEYILRIINEHHLLSIFLKLENYLMKISSKTN